ncbi:ATP-dependent DNA helicase RecG [Membranihabitans maritimus]|uniref:ATP-dependent DNA helicase RecG n=1 Tax=Membranihabitans maritimus TaxID=2904244 RepID=UPI001EFF9570|nr:ATP-dependent DNA helicase RecG [Membranihabitans maritimus]
MAFRNYFESQELVFLSFELIRSGLLLPNAYLSKKIEFIKGIGPARSELLEKELGMKKLEDLLMDFPIRYQDRTSISSIAQAKSGNFDWVQLKAVIRDYRIIGRKHPKRLVALATDESGSLELVWFKSHDWIIKQLVKGEEYIINGKLTKFRNSFNIAHPELELAREKKTKVSGNLIPIYRSTEKLTKRGLDTKGRGKIMKGVVAGMSRDDFWEYLPDYLIDKFKFSSIYDTIRNVHFPESQRDLKIAENRIIFEEFFFLQLRLIKQYLNKKKQIKGIVFPEVGDLFLEFFNDHLPFSLTGAQERVLKEIRRDLGSGVQMNRLLQGDVGSGKTIVAFMTVLLARDNGYQSCLMAPTEILAQQHFESISELAKDMRFRVALLTGSVKGSQRKELLRMLRLGAIDLVIGTHALIEDKVIFDNLGLSIIDEQHRFGVAQRAKLWQKGKELPPHVLIMSATPIPRTLHMTTYGDLDVSVIDELPPGRKPVKTLHKTEYFRPDVIKFMKKQIAEGRQIYIVYPLIEESENMDLEDLNNGYEKLMTFLPRPDYQIGVVHGRMKPEEKEKEMQRFSAGTTHILVSTTVIEVGVNVPNASVMIIENANRFGLSQLHQLRGRVGRGANQSYCILMTGNKLSEEAKVRLNTMVRTTDGFEVAEVDLALRGPGNIQGLEQSGKLVFKKADLIEHKNILKISREVAREILDEDPELLAPEHRGIRKYLETRHKKAALWSRIS